MYVPNVEVRCVPDGFQFETPQLITGNAPPAIINTIPKKSRSFNAIAINPTIGNIADEIVKIHLKCIATFRMNRQSCIDNTV